MTRRLPTRLLWLVAASLLIATILFLLFSRPNRTRLTVAFATNPVMVWSYDLQKAQVAIVVLPSDAVTEAAWGYGEYPIGALWKLGAIEKRGGHLLAMSTEHALAVPVHFFAGEKRDVLTDMNDPVGYGKAFFSITKTVQFFARRLHTNLALSEFLTLSWQAQTAKADKFMIVDLRPSVKTVTQTLPDGSERIVLDSTQVDELLKGVFEDERVRQEAKTVAIFNMVDVPTLGNRIARMVSSMGAFVVSVGNSEPAVDRCVVGGSKGQLESVTAKRMVEYFNCTTEETGDTSRADLVLKVGKRYAAEFIPL